MNDLQAEMCLKWIVILIPVKQRVSAIQTESCNQAIHRLPSSEPLSTLPQGAVVLRRGYGQVDSACRTPGISGDRDALA